MEQYSVGDVVWIKIPKYPWWPAKVIPKEDCPTIYTGNKPGVYVKFLNEEYFEHITDNKKIKHFDYEGKNELIEKGSEIAGKNHLRLEFDGAISIALEVCQQTSTSCHDNDKIMQTKNSLEKCEKQTVNYSSEIRQAEKEGEIQPQTKGNSEVNKVLFRNEVFHSKQSDCCEEEHKDVNTRTEVNRDQVQLETLNKLISYSKRKWMVNDDNAKRKNVSDDTSKRKRLKINSNGSNVQKNRYTETRSSDELVRNENENIIDDSNCNYAQKKRKTRKRGSVELTKSENADITSSLDCNTGNSQKNRKTRKSRSVELTRSENADITSSLECNTGNSQKNRKTRKSRSVELTKSENANSENEITGSSNVSNQQKIGSTKKQGSVELTRSENSNITDSFNSNKSQINRKRRKRRSVEVTRSENSNSENKITDSSSHNVVESCSCNTETEHNTDNENFLEDSWYLPTPEPNRTTSVFRPILNTNSLSFDPNLSKDVCDDEEDVDSDDTDSDSDVDFPEGLSPIIGAYPISEKDIIWVRWKKYPFWPAYVRRIYRKRRHITKISIMFLGKREEIPKILTLGYRPKKMLHFVHRDKDEFIRMGKSQEDTHIKRHFIEALELAEDYLNKKALGLMKTGELAFLFDNIDENQIEHMDEENWEQSDTGDDEKSSCKNYTDLNNYTGVQIDDEQPILDMNDGLTKKEQEKQLKSKQKQKDLVSFIMSDKMKAFLFDIRTGKRKSERHEKFFSRRTKVRQSLRYTGFGPIANEEQQEEIIATFIKWLIECDLTEEKTLPDAGYVLDVWIPEALVHALTQVKTYSRSVAWKRIDSGSGLF